MKRFTTTVKDKKGANKTVKVWVDNETARVLEEAGNEKIRHKYLADEYNAKLIERRETRRHQSYEQCVENGYDVISKGENGLERLERLETREEIRKLLTCLTEKQRSVFVTYVLEGQTFRSIGESMGVSQQTVRESYWAAVRKLRKKITETPFETA